ncbi:hypothetical protein CC80DRAFT_163449 [Byssothecium circinans]|uniref:Uncharacterized protein n=1 Tax=Byssothecium circinans TaxID=147558 RepID=A0A6A5UCD0_9PLEO|nr:hypothetical protein CC80DRAFT_163449 [Byssothecium circinans]
MLGLRPRLKSRPSLLDLVRRNSIDQISQRPALLKTDEHPLRIPLPQSPVLAPSVVVSPPPFAPEEESIEEEGLSADDKEEELEVVAKMPPKPQKQEDGDEQTGSVFSISGYVTATLGRNAH